MAEMGPEVRTLQSREWVSEHFRVSEPKPRGADRTYTEHCLLSDLCSHPSWPRMYVARGS